MYNIDTMVLKDFLDVTFPPLFMLFDLYQHKERIIIIIIIIIIVKSQKVIIADR